jgi:hypothetical protein
MEIARDQLTILLNALYDLDETAVPVKHPSDEIDELLRIELGEADASQVKLTTRRRSFEDARNEIRQEYGDDVATEVPEPDSYLNAMLAGGLVQPPNQDDIDAFLDRYGTPDLTAGHKPAVAGFDTNLLPWRMADVLDISPGSDSTVNGFALATGVRDELDWDYKRDGTRELEKAFGEEFSQLWNQPSGSRREGRLGENYYRLLRDHRYADEVPTDRGDDEIVQGYDRYQEDNRKDVLLFSNDRDFIERARSHRVLSQRVEFPQELPRSVDVSWDAIQDTLYVLAVLFGVIKLPKVTLYGVWKGKGGGAWQDEQLRVACRSPKIEPLLERDLQIISDSE